MEKRHSAALLNLYSTTQKVEDVIARNGFCDEAICQVAAEIATISKER